MKLKKHIVGTYILIIFLHKLSYRQESSSIVLLPIDKNLKIHLYYAFLSLNFVICL